MCSHGQYDLRITDIKIDADSIDMDLCQSHVDGIPDLHHLSCDHFHASTVAPAPDERILNQIVEDHNTDIKPFYSLWSSIRPNEDAVVKIHYKYLGLKMVLERKIIQGLGVH